MGMYDSIKCYYPLPYKFKVEQSTIEFQTKDLENFMADYEISKKGYLYLIESKSRLLSKRELKKYEGQIFHPIMTSWNTGKKIRQNYHGILNFYTSFGEHDGLFEWVEFNAYFVYGKIDKIKKGKCYKEDRRLSNG